MDRDLLQRTLADLRQSDAQLVRRRGLIGDACSALEALLAEPQIADDAPPAPAPVPAPDPTPPPAAAPLPPAPAAGPAVEGERIVPRPPRVVPGRSSANPVDHDELLALVRKHGPASPATLAAHVSNEPTHQTVYWALRRLAKQGLVRDGGVGWVAVDADSSTSSEEPEPQEVSGSATRDEGAETRSAGPRAVPSLPPVQSSALNQEKLLDLIVTFADEAKGMTIPAMVDLLPWAVKSRLDSNQDVHAMIEQLIEAGLVRRVALGRWAATDAGVDAADGR